MEELKERLIPPQNSNSSIPDHTVSLPNSRRNTEKSMAFHPPLETANGTKTSGENASFIKKRTSDVPSPLLAQRSAGSGYVDFKMSAFSNQKTRSHTEPSTWARRHGIKENSDKITIPEDSIGISINSSRIPSKSSPVVISSQKIDQFSKSYSYLSFPEQPTSYCWFACKMYIILVIIFTYVAYLFVAMWLDFQRSIPLLAITVFCLAGIINGIIYKSYKKWLHDKCWKALIECHRWCVRRNTKLVCIIGGLMVFTFIMIDAARHPQHLIPGVGLFFYIFTCWAFSAFRTKIKWRPIITGLLLQWVFALAILRTNLGIIFHFIGMQLATFLNFSDEGAKYLFGHDFEEHYFFFKVIPTIVFYSCVVSILYFYGIFQWLTLRIAWILHLMMGTSLPESINAAGNIFLGQTEAPLLIAPFIQDMTMSELHSVMTSGFATVAGGVMAAYISFGISASDLIVASIMSAPAALVVSKLLYPETEKSTSQIGDGRDLMRITDKNIIQAVTRGALDSIPLITNIIVMLLSFLSLIRVVDALLSWFGNFVGYPEFSFELICSYILIPFPWLMGVEWKDCSHVAILIGKKLFINEFVAFQTLSDYIVGKENGEEPMISHRSEIISTYALCGFANIGSMGIQLAGMTPLAPNRAQDIARLGIRAMMAGTIASFMTACIIGSLYPD